MFRPKNIKQLETTDSFRIRLKRKFRFTIRTIVRRIKLENVNDCQKKYYTSREHCREH